MEDDAVRRRQAAALAGHTNDIETARRLATDRDPAVRATALAALARLKTIELDDIATALLDESTIVRRRACQLAIGTSLDLVPLLDDDPGVAEQAAWALGERGAAVDHDVTAALAEMAVSHQDALCREAAVAALGAIGDATAIPAILHATTDKPAIRRRAVIALAPFEGPEVGAALERARSDRDWQVRQAAEDLA